MNQIANVVFAYSPKNDDELELTVGDKIEVIGIEEEGWWKGRLKGRTGVFPSNFVQIIESATITQNSNKLNSLFGSLISTKNSISSNSLNNINTNSAVHLNNNNSTSNNNLKMNNTQHQEIASPNECSNPNSAEDASSFHTANSTMHSERRPKPIWSGIGYGDIFAAGAKARPLPADPPNGSSTRPAAMASERLSTTSLASTLQKPIPKKPPPPAPADVSGTNGSPQDQAPALPPKPSNHFSPFMHQRPLPQVTQQRTVIERVQVIYAYKPSNSDELEMEVGDIIDVLDKNIEDQGWWRGELKGKVGVFPDNFVQSLGTQQEAASGRGRQKAPNSIIANAGSYQSNSSDEGQAAQAKPINAPESVGKIKSVFAGTPKGFSKELESNLERHNNSNSFLSLKRNESQHQQVSGPAGDVASVKNNAENISGVFNPSQAIPNNQHNLTSSMTSDTSPPRQNGYNTSGSNPLDSTSPGKLNHITANRAKGPTRRPPKNILNKRNQLNDSSSSNESKRDVFTPKDDHMSSPGSAAYDPTNNNSNLNTAPLPQNVAFTEVLSSSPATSDHSNQQQNVTSQTKTKSSPQTIQAVTTTTNPSPPPWMVELRKTNAEKKRDPPSTATVTNSVVGSVDESKPPASVPFTPAVTTSQSVTDPTGPSKLSPTTPTLPSSERTSLAGNASVTNQLTASQESSDNLNAARHSSMLKQISDNVTKEIHELRLEVKKLQLDFKGIEELKSAVEGIKVELKACQSATESQRKYIKDLVTNLADERKKIAAMQVEIDRNLK